MMNLFEMLQAIFGKNIMSKTIGTRTNVIKFPSNKNNPLTTSFDVARASDNPALIEKLKKIIEDEAPYIAKMNDSEKAIYEGNVRRLHDHLVSTGEIKPVVSAEVIGLGDKQPVTGKGLEDLIQKQGTQNPPTTVSGQVEQQGKKLEGLSEQLDKEFVKGKKRSVSDILDDYFSSYKDMKSVEDEGLVRAVARQIMYQDLNAGKLKVPKEVEETIRGMSSKDVLDDFSQWYGSAALEDLYQNADKFYKMSAPQDAIKFLKENKYSNWEEVYQPREKPIKEYMEPEEFKKLLSDSAYNRNGMFVPKGSEKLDEKTLKEIEDFYSKQKPKEIENEIRRMEEGHIFGEFQEEDKKTILQKLLELLKKTPPEAGIVGGIGVGTLANKATEDTGDKGLTYLTGGDNNYSMATGGRVGYQTGGPTNKILKYMIDTLVKEKDFNRGLLEKSKPELVEGLFKQTYGKSAEEIADAVNKQLKGKSSMEVMNPKTGEITSPKKPVMTVDDLKNKHEDAFNAHDQIRVDLGDKIAPDMIAESMAEIKGKDYFDLSQKEQSDYYKKALAYVDDVKMIKRQNKMSISNEMNQAKQEGIQKTNKMIELGLNPSSSKDYDKFLEMESIQKKYGNMIDNDLLQKIMVDDNPMRKAEVLGTIDEAMKMQEKGLSPQEIIDIMKNTTRTKQADGGIIRKKYGHEGAANPKRAQITAIYGEGTLPKDYSKGLGYLSGE